MNAVMTRPPAGARRAQRAVRLAPRRRWWDTALTILLLVALGGLSLVAALSGVLMMSVAGACGPRECHTMLVRSAGLVGLLGPLVVVMAASVAAIVRLAAGRIAFWVPLAGAALIVACPALQEALLMLAVP